jgi:uncharacterized membrane protein
MYTIVGGDGNEYGPVTEDAIRQWIAEGRANSGTLFKEVDASEWTKLGESGQFLAAIQAAEHSRASKLDPPEAPSDIQDQIDNEDIDFNEVDIEVLGTYTKGISLLLNNIGLLLGASMLVWIMGFIPKFIPLIGGLISLIIDGALAGGLCYVFIRTIRKESVSIGDIFAGFRFAFPALLMGHALTWFISNVGLVFCIIPGVYFFVAWTFTEALIIDKELDFWSAMSIGRQAVTQNFFSIVGLLTLCFLPQLIYWLYMYAEMFKILYPLMPQPPEVISIADMLSISETMAKDEEVASKITSLGFGLQLVKAVTIPIVMAATMHAYESLFSKPQR